jgi:hypothetical protein
MGYDIVKSGISVSVFRKKIACFLFSVPPNLLYYFDPCSLLVVLCICFTIAQPYILNIITVIIIIAIEFIT